MLCDICKEKSRCYSNGPKRNPTERKGVEKESDGKFSFCPFPIYYFNFRKRAENISSVRFSKLVGPFPYFLRSVSSFIQVRFLYFFCRFPLIFGRLTNFLGPIPLFFCPSLLFSACFLFFYQFPHFFSTFPLIFLPISSFFLSVYSFATRFNISFARFHIFF